MNYALRIAEQLKPHLRGLRKSRGLTQAQLGALVGVRQARIAEIEAKPGVVSLDQLMTVLAALGATLQLNPGNTEGAQGADDSPVPAEPNPLVRPTAKAAGSDVRVPQVGPAPLARAQRPRKPAKPAVPRVAVTIPAKKGVW